MLILKNPAFLTAKHRFPSPQKSKLTVGSGKAGRKREEVDEKGKASPSTVLAVETLDQGTTAGGNLTTPHHPGMSCRSRVF